MRGEFGVDDVVRDHRERRQEESQLKHLELGKNYQLLNYEEKNCTIFSDIPSLGSLCVQQCYRSELLTFR